MKKVVILVLLWCLGIGSMWAQKEATASPYGVGAKWYYHIESPFWFVDPPGGDINKAEIKIGVVAYEITAEEIDPEDHSTKYTVQRIAYNHLKEIESETTEYIYVLDGSVWGQEEGGERNLLHKAGVTEGDTFPILIRTLDYREWTIREKTPGFLECDKASDTYCYTVWVEVDTLIFPDGWFPTRQFYCYDPHIGILYNGLNPLSGTWRPGIVDASTRMDREEYELRSYIDPQGVEHKMPWWENNPLSAQGPDAVYYRPLDITSIYNQAELFVYDRDGGIISAPNSQMRLYAMTGELVAQGADQLHVAHLSSNVYVLQLEGISGVSYYNKIIIKN